jgi:hypothetical protein
MNKVSSWNKLNIAKDKFSPKTQEVTWPASKAETWRELHLKIQFPKRNNRLPGQTVRPTIFCLYSFFSVEYSYRFRLRKSWKNPKIDQVMEKNSKNTKCGAQCARMRADCFWSARSEKQVFLNNCHVHLCCVRSKLIVLQPLTW